ncbi:MAG TPA: sulfite exporter TauE/SafE family protein, partial [Thermoplasmatales archaeon]|nr:sulfite exporter TauE/SafE family protein [Thermoplasmatales archaeon]
FFGLTTGFVSGFSGMGGAGMLVFIFVLLFRYDLHTAIGTSLLLSFFIGGSGALAHVLSNETLFDVALVAAVAAAFGAVSGAIFANRVDEDKLGRLIGVVVLLSGFLLLVKAFV